MEEAAQLASRMRALKWVVSILGILLVIAMITTVAGVIYKARHAGPAGSATSTPGGGMPVPAGFGTAALSLPAGCQIASATASGDRLVIVASGAGDACRLVLVTDLRSGRLIGQFSFQAP